MGAPAPAPANLRAMSDAWDNPVAFGRELAQYYKQLRESGHFDERDWTEPTKEDA